MLTLGFILAAVVLIAVVWIMLDRTVFERRREREWEQVHGRSQARRGGPSAASGDELATREEDKTRPSAGRPQEGPERAPAKRPSGPPPEEAKTEMHLSPKEAYESVFARLLISATDADNDSRDVAIQALGHLGDARALPALAEAFRDSDVRVTALEALSHINDSRAFGPVVEALADQDEYVREVAARVLGEMGDGRAFDALVRALGDSDPDVRGAAACALGTLGCPDAVESLARALDDPDAEVADAAVEALGQVGGPTSVAPLLQALGGSDYNVRRTAARALEKLAQAVSEEDVLLKARDVLPPNTDFEGKSLLTEVRRLLCRIGRVRSLEAVLRATECDDYPVLLEDTKALVKRVGSEHAIPVIHGVLCGIDPGNMWDVRLAAELLAEMGNDESLALLKEAQSRCVGDSGDVVRAAIAVVAARSPANRSETSLDDVLRVLRDDYLMEAHVGLRCGALTALCDLGDPRALALLTEAVRSARPEVRGAAARALAKLKQNEALSSLIEAVAHPDGTTRQAAAEALADLGEATWRELITGAEDDFVRLEACGDRRVLEVLAKRRSVEVPHRADAQAHINVLLRSTDAFEQADAARSLGELEDRRAAEALVGLLSAPDEFVREAAAEALGGLSDLSALEPLIGSLSDSDSGVRDAASQALRRLGETVGTRWCEPRP